MFMDEPAEKSKNATDAQSFSQFIEAMTPGQLGTLAFKLGAFAWIGLNICFFGWQPVYCPGAYLNPNALNWCSAAVLLYSSYLSLRAMSKGSHLPAVMTLTFLWSVCCTIARVLMQ